MWNRGLAKNVTPKRHKNGFPMSPPLEQRWIECRSSFNLCYLFRTRAAAGACRRCRPCLNSCLPTFFKISFLVCLYHYVSFVHMSHLPGINSLCVRPAWTWLFWEYILTSHKLHRTATVGPSKLEECALTTSLIDPSTVASIASIVWIV